MKAIILSAGQGKRLLPLTESLPKCLLDVAGRTILEWQIDTLHQVGVDDIVVVTGYGASKVNSLVTGHYADMGVRTLYNPNYAVSDNLVSCYWARGEMDQDFLLLNGDTLFETQVVRQLLAESVSPITVTINSKESYDEDDMKVILDKRRLVRIGKDLPVDRVHGESIGLIRFLGEGPAIFREALELAVQEPESRSRWYLSVIDSIAQHMPVMTCSITGLSWCEIDYPTDLENAGSVMAASAALYRVEEAMHADGVHGAVQQHR